VKNVDSSKKSTESPAKIEKKDEEVVAKSKSKKDKEKVSDTKSGSSAELKQNPASPAKSDENGKDSPVKAER
jgi:hypothetical protein